MTYSELDNFLQENTNIECKTDDEFTYFRNNDLPWYANNPGNCTRVTTKIFEKLTPDELK